VSRGAARWLWLVLLAALLSAAPAGWPQESPTLDSVLVEALDRSAELYSLRAQIEAAEAMIAPAGALPDPMLSVGLKNLPVDDGLRLDRDPMSAVEIMASQEVPRPSKRRLRAEVQAREVTMLQARYQDKRLDTIKRVKQVYLDLQSLDVQIAIAEQNRDLAQDMLAAAEAAYGTGRAMQQDVFQAQVRLSQMVDMIISLQGKRAAAQARLNRLLYRPAGQAFPALPPPTLTSVPIQADVLAPLAEQNSPRLAEMRARVGQAEQSERLAAEGIKPDYRFDLSYMIRQPIEMSSMGGTDMWSASVGINLPSVYRRHTVDQEVKATHAGRVSAEQEVEAMRNEIAAMIAEMVSEVITADQQLSLLDTGLLPQAEGALAASRASYGTGRGEILDLLDNQVNLFNLQMRRVMLLAEREQNLAELEYLIGGSLIHREGGSDAQ